MALTGFVYIIKAMRAVSVLLLMFHLSQAQFTIQPVSVERAEGLEAVFSCQYQVEGFVVTYDWSINNSLVTTDTEIVRARPPPSSLGGPTTLTILATPQQNNSVVQCLAIIRDGIVLVRSDTSVTATLTVYATIITNVFTAPNTITVMWSALLLTEYCVNITKTTVGSNETAVLDSVCGLANEYIFTYSNPISVCDRFSFTVTPTEGEMGGTTSEPDTGFFQTAKGSSGEGYLIHDNGETKSIEFRIEVPSCLSFISYKVDSDLLMITTNHSITNPLFDGLLCFSLPTDLVTEYNVTLTSINGINLVFENIPISTFDVQDLLVSESPGGGGICVSIEYVEGTVSPGALVCVIRIIDGVLDFFSNFNLLPIPRSASDNVTITLPGGEYRLIAFDLESSNIPRVPISMVADSEEVIVYSGGRETATPPSSSEGITVIKLPNGDAQVTCTNPGVTCLVLFWSTIDLDSALVGFIQSFASSTVFSLTEAFSDGYVVVYSWNIGESVFSGRVSLVKQLDPPTTITDALTAPYTVSPTNPIPGSESFTAGAIAGTTIVIILFLLVATALGVVIVILKKRKKSMLFKVEVPSSDGRVDWSSTFVGIEQPNEAYAPVLQRNIAYEQTKKPRGQKIDDSQAPATTEGDYESIEPVHCDDFIS